MKLLITLTLILTACGHESDTQEYKYITNTIEPNVVVDNMQEMPYCINQCDVLFWKGFGRFYCDGTAQWKPLTSPVNCPMD